MKPFIEMDREIEYMPPSLPANTSTGDVSSDTLMFASMTSSISSVILKEPPRDLLTEDPSPPPVGYADFETLSLGPNGDEMEENRELDEEVARSLNSQVILDQMTNKDLFGSVPFNDKELLVSWWCCV